MPISKKLLFPLCFVLLLTFFPSLVNAWQAGDTPVSTMNLGLQIGGDFQAGRFSVINSIEVGSDGKIYVLDSRNNLSQIQVFSSSGEYLSKINPGEEIGEELFSSDDIAVDQYDNIYVHDMYTHEIVKLNASGELLSAFSTVRAGDSPYAYYCSLAVDSEGNVYVSDRINQSVRKFNPSGEYLAGYTFQLVGTELPSSIVVGSNGHIYVALMVSIGGGEFRIVEFNPDMTLVGTIFTYGIGYDIGSISDIEVDSYGNIYFADSGNNLVVKLDSSGEQLSQFGTIGVGYGFFRGVAEIGLNSGGENIYVADAAMGSVQKFNSTGGYISTLGIDFFEDGMFNNPSDVALGEGGNIYVVDTLNARVQEFNSAGVYQSKFGHYRSDSLDEEGFLNPVGIETDLNGNIYVLDSSPFESENFVKKFDHNGNYLFGIEAQSPEKIETDAFGNVYFIESSYVLKKYQGDGEFVADVEATEVGIDYLAGMELDDSGNMYFYGSNDSEGPKIVKTTSNGEILHSVVVPGDGWTVDGVVIESNGDFYVSTVVQDEETEIESSNLLKYDSSWNLLFTLTSEDVGFEIIAGMELDSQDNLFIADQTNGRVLKLTQDKMPPEVSIKVLSTVSEGEEITISGVATDTLTPIDNLQYQVDSQDGSWLQYEGKLPKDKRVDFILRIANLEAGSHTVYVKASDSKTNETIKGVSIKVLPGVGLESNSLIEKTDQLLTPLEIHLRTAKGAGKISFSWDTTEVQDAVCTFEVKNLSGDTVLVPKEVSCLDAKILENGDIQDLDDGSVYIATITIRGAEGNILGYSSTEFTYQNEAIETVPEKLQEVDGPIGNRKDIIFWILGVIIVGILSVAFLFISKRKRM